MRTRPLLTMSMLIRQCAGGPYGAGYRAADALLSLFIECLRDNNIDCGNIDVGQNLTIITQIDANGDVLALPIFYW